MILRYKTIDDNACKAKYNDGVNFDGETVRLLKNNTLYFTTSTLWDRREDNGSNSDRK